MTRRCVYCGYPTSEFRRRACDAHGDLTELDPTRRAAVRVGTPRWYEGRPTRVVQSSAAGLHGARGVRPPSGAPPTTESR